MVREESDEARFFFTAYLVVRAFAARPASANAE
jgi:hypothetical protein